MKLFFLGTFLVLFSVTNAANFNWTSYQNLAAIDKFLDDVLEKYPDVTEGFVVGKSYENRPIRGIKISYKSGNPGVFVESTIHAREWITAATATYLINELLTSNNSTVRKLAEEQDWYIIPVLNVDGYEYSFTTDRLWRKNRQPTYNASCIGTDLNRNYNSHWMTEGCDASADACDECYAGTGANSAPEIKAVSDFILKNNDKFNIFLSFHNYGELVYVPYDHTGVKPKNYKDLMSVARAYSNAAEREKWATSYDVGQLYNIKTKYFDLDAPCGESFNWAYEEANIPLSFLIEFRDLGELGFELPESIIIPNSIEALTGITAMVKKARKLKYMNARYS